MCFHALLLEMVAQPGLHCPFIILNAQSNVDDQRVHSCERLDIEVATHDSSFLQTPVVAKHSNGARPKNPQDGCLWRHQAAGAHSQRKILNVNLALPRQQSGYGLLALANRRWGLGAVDDF